MTCQGSIIILCVALGSVSIILRAHLCSYTRHISVEAARLFCPCPRHRAAVSRRFILSNVQCPSQSVRLASGARIRVCSRPGMYELITHSHLSRSVYAKCQGLPGKPACTRFSEWIFTKDYISRPAGGRATDTVLGDWPARLSTAAPATGAGWTDEAALRRRGRSRRLGGWWRAGRDVID